MRIAWLLLITVALAGCGQPTLSEMNLVKADLPAGYQLVNVTTAEAFRTISGATENPGMGNASFLAVGDVTPQSMRGSVWGLNGSVKGAVYSFSLQFGSYSQLEAWMGGQKGGCGSGATAHYKDNILALIFTFDEGGDEIVASAADNLRGRTGAHDLCSDGPWI